MLIYFFCIKNAYGSSIIEIKFYIFIYFIIILSNISTGSTLFIELFIILILIIIFYDKPFFTKIINIIYFLILEYNKLLFNNSKLITQS